MYENKIKWGDAFLILYDVNDLNSFEEVTRIRYLISHYHTPQRLEYLKNKVKEQMENFREDREASKPSQARKRAKSNEGGVTRVGKRVYVGNLKFTTSWQTLKDHFKPVGDVVHAKLIARGCGIVEFETPEDARRAILELNDSELEGRPLQVREDREDRDLK